MWYSVRGIETNQAPRLRVQSSNQSRAGTGNQTKNKLQKKRSYSNKKVVHSKNGFFDDIKLPPLTSSVGRSSLQEALDERGHLVDAPVMVYFALQCTNTLAVEILAGVDKELA